MENDSPDNPVAEYARAERIQATELGKRLNISKGAASEMINGLRGCGKKTALRMEELTGRPWHEFIFAGNNPKRRPANAGAAA